MLKKYIISTPDGRNMERVDSLKFAPNSWLVILELQLKALQTQSQFNVMRF